MKNPSIFIVKQHILYPKLCILGTSGLGLHFWFPGIPRHQLTWEIVQKVSTFSLASILISHCSAYVINRPLVVALARLKVSKMHAGWWYSFISSPSLNGLGVILAILLGMYLFYSLYQIFYRIGDYMTRERSCFVQLDRTKYNSHEKSGIKTYV